MENANNSATPRLIYMVMDIVLWESVTFRCGFVGTLPRESQEHESMRRMWSLCLLVPSRQQKLLNRFCPLWDHVQVRVNGVSTSNIWERFQIEGFESLRNL